MAPNSLETAADLEAAFIEWNELLFRYAYGRVGEAQAAEDIVQETFFKAWRKKDSFDPKLSSLKNWLFVIMINLIRDQFRSKKSLPNEELDENFVSETNVEEAVSQKDTIRFVLEKMDHLPERDRELLLLRYVQDLSLQEIAEVMNLQYSAAKVALHRALQKLKTLCTET